MLYNAKNELREMRNTVILLNKEKRNLTKLYFPILCFLVVYGKSSFKLKFIPCIKQNVYIRVCL